MSQCRAQLWGVVRHARPENVIYMDTDSLLVNATGRGYLEGERFDSGNENVIEKATWDHALIHGPRNIELDQDRRLSGVPRRAERKGPLEWEGTIMRGIKESIVRDELDHVAHVHRPYH